MKLSPEFLFEVSQQVMCWNQVCDYFGLTEEQKRDPNCGKWIIEWIKDMQQVTAIYKTKALFPNTKTEISPSSNPLLEENVSVSE